MITKLSQATVQVSLGLQRIYRMYCMAVGLFLLGTPAIFAQDIGMIALLKGQHYEQTKPGLVALVNMDSNIDTPLFSFAAFVQGTTSNVLESGTLKFPDNSISNLVYSAEEWMLDHEYGCETLFDLDRGRTNGAYTFVVDTVRQGVITNTLSLIGDAYPAQPPMVTNFSDLQVITNVAQEITLQWAAMPECTSNDYIKVSISGPDWMEWATPEFGQEGALNGTNTFATLPPNKLSMGCSYVVEIMVVRAVEKKMDPVMAIAAYFVRTDLEIHTAPPSSFDFSVPGAYGVNVPVSSAISFRFTQPMDAGFISVAWAGTGLDTNSFSYSWCDNNRVLVCSYPTNLPTNCDISWTLNLEGFQDAFGRVLQGEKMGSFHTVADYAGGTNTCILTKRRSYQQVGDTRVSISFDAHISVELTAFNLVIPPAALSVSDKLYTLEMEEWYPEYYLDTSYTSQTQLDAFFPNGTYAAHLPMRGGGIYTNTLELGAVDDYPIIPTITDLAALQNINSSNTIVIAWTPLGDFNSTPMQGASVIEVEICNAEDGDSMYWFEPGDPNITASGLTIPTNTLWPGRTYQVNVAFIHITDLNEGEGQFSLASFSTMTEFTIQTAGTPIMPVPSFQSQLGGVSLLFEGGEPNRRYVIETSTDLIRWIPQLDLQANEGSTAWYQDFDAQFLSARFYRLRDWASADGWVEPPVSIQGTVWTDSSHTTPVVGAQVGTDLDGQVTTTDKDGRFFLETETTLRGQNPSYTITIRSGAGNRDLGPFSWGHHPRGQNFGLVGSFN